MFLFSYVVDVVVLVAVVTVAPIADVVFLAVVVVLFIIVAFSLVGDICSLIVPDDIASCGSKNISKTSCEAMGCCWKDAKVQNTENYSNLRNIHCYRFDTRC